MILAAIDVGTNSTRLYVAERAGEAHRQIDRDLLITRLGEGVDRNGTLAASAIERTVNAIRNYAGRARDAGARHIRVAATSAVRDASNRNEFIDAVRAATGLSVDVLSGEQEAALSFAGAVADLGDHPEPYCVLDIGGGSTEIVVGSSSVEGWVSLDIGSVRLTERCIDHDPPQRDEVDAVASSADAALHDAAAMRAEAARTLVGVAGTITTIAAVSLGLPGYDRDAIHHIPLNASEIAEVVDRLSSMTSEQRRDLPAMPRGREDVIVAGGVILQRVMARFGFDRVVVSESDILDGLVASLA